MGKKNVKIEEEVQEIELSSDSSSDDFEVAEVLVSTTPKVEEKNSKKNKKEDKKSKAAKKQKDESDDTQSSEEELIEINKKDKQAKSEPQTGDLLNFLDEFTASPTAKSPTNDGIENPKPQSQAGDNSTFDMFDMLDGNKKQSKPIATTKSENPSKVKSKSKTS